MTIDKLKEKRAMLTLAFASLLILSAFIAPVSASIKSVGGLLVAEVEPGQHIEHEILVGISDTDPAMDFEVKIGWYGQTLEGAGGTTMDVYSPYSAAEYLEVTPESFHLEPGESATVIVEGDVPSDVEEGGSYGLVDICTVPKGEGQVSISIGIRAPIYLTIKDSDLELGGEIKEVNLSNLFSKFDPVILVAFENTGNYHYKASAEIVLEDEDGNEFFTTESRPQTIMPTNTIGLRLPVELDEDLEPGTYYVEATVFDEDGDELDSDDTTFDV